MSEGARLHFPLPASRLGGGALEQPGLACLSVLLEVKLCQSLALCSYLKLIN